MANILPTNPAPPRYIDPLPPGETPTPVTLPPGFIGPPAPGEIVTPTPVPKEPAPVVLPPGFIGPPAPGEVVSPTPAPSPKPTPVVLPPGFIGPPAPGETVTPSPAPAEPTPAKPVVLPPGFIGPPAPGEVKSPAPVASPSPAPAKPATDAQALITTIAKANNIVIKDVTDLSAAETEALLKAGVDANSIARAGESPDQVNNVVDKINVEQKAEQEKQNAALKDLKGYTDTNGNININQYLLDAKSPGPAIQKLKDAGFTSTQISVAANENNDLAKEASAKVAQEYSNVEVAKYAGHLVADMVIPGLSTAENWNNLSTWQKIVYPALDVVCLVPVVGEAAKGAEIVAKGLSTGAELASLGGRDAVELAAKDAADQLEQAVAKRAGQEALVNKAADLAAKEVNPAMKEVYEAATQNAKEDLALTDKELPQLTKHVDNLQKLAENAKEVDVANSAGAKVYKTAEKVNTFTDKVKVGIKTDNLNAQTSLKNVIEKGGAAALSGVSAVITIKDWKDLSATQKVAGILMTALPLGILGKARNAAEDIADPYKIPEKAIGSRAVRGGKPIPGIIWAEDEAHTTRLVIDPSVPPEQARDAMASLMRQLHKDGGVAKVEYAGHEVTLKGTDFQKTVGGNVSFSGTPHGEVFKEGTGAFGTKTRLETYLTAVNEKLKSKDPITIEATYKAKDPVTGEITDQTVTTNVTPGVTSKGSEGGLYTAESLKTSFSHQAAFGSKGKIDAGLIIHDMGIDKLPKDVAHEKLRTMEKDAEKEFDGTHDVNKIVESFKKYKTFAEGENVITNGSQIKRVQNLRSHLTDMLHLNRGEYYTRDSQGRIELFQMYIEGGRTTPYTLKELYQLKGNGLKNALADMGVGLANKLDELRGKRPTAGEEIYSTKEEQINAAFSRIDQDLKEGKIKSEDVLDAKRQAIEDARDTAKEELRRELLEQARHKALEAAREGTRAMERQDETVRSDSYSGRTAASRAPIARADALRVDTTRTDAAGTNATRNNGTSSDRITADTSRTDRTTNNRTPTDSPDRTATDRTPADRTDGTTTDRIPTERTDRAPANRTDRTPRTDKVTNTTDGKPPVKTPKPTTQGGHTDQTEWPDGTIVWNQGELGGNGKLNIIHHISPYPYDMEYTSFLTPKGMKNAHLDTTKATIQALGGKVLRDADLKIGFEIAHIRKGSSDIYFSPDETLMRSVRRTKSAAPHIAKVPVISTSTRSGPSAAVVSQKPFSIVKMHHTRQGGLTRRSDR